MYDLLIKINAAVILQVFGFLIGRSFKSQRLFEGIMYFLFDWYNQTWFLVYGYHFSRKEESVLGNSYFTHRFIYMIVASMFCNVSGLGCNQRIFPHFLPLSSHISRYESKCQPCPDPVISVLSPDRHFGSVSETFLSRVYDYVSLNPDGLLTEGSNRYCFWLK